MAGVYPDVVGKRLAWDRDGSQMFRWDRVLALTRTLASARR